MVVPKKLFSSVIELKPSLRQGEDIMETMLAEVKRLSWQGTVEIWRKELMKEAQGIL